MREWVQRANDVGRVNFHAAYGDSWRGADHHRETVQRALAELDALPPPPAGMGPWGAEELSRVRRRRDDLRAELDRWGWSPSPNSEMVAAPGKQRVASGAARTRKPKWERQLERVTT